MGRDSIAAAWSILQRVTRTIDPNNILVIRQFNVHSISPDQIASTFGISAAAWHGKKALMAEQALASGSPGNNPRIPEAAEIIALYESMYPE